MALRFHLPFTSLDFGAGAEEWDVELWFNSFSGDSTEVDGDFEGLDFDWEGESDLAGGVMPSSCTMRVLVSEDSSLDIAEVIDPIKNAAEGEVKMVVRRGGSTEVYWAGWVHPDQCSYPDAWKFHFEVYATDGIARLKDVDYADGDTPYTGEETLLQHVLKIIDKIGTDDVGTWPTAKIRSTANWFSNGMNTTTCPAHQAKLRHDRFHGLDREGNTQHWNSYAVLDALMRAMGCQFLHENGQYHIRQLSKYADSTQKAYYYDATGTLLSSPTENLDLTVDYATAGAMVKQAGGRYTFLPPLKEVCVDYHHVTAKDKGIGQSWGTADETWHTLPGAVLVDDPDTTYLKCSVRLRHKSNIVVIPSGSQPYPDHRLRFSFQFRLEDNTNPGDYYYLKRVQGVSTPFFDIQPSEMEWFFNGSDEFKIWARPINDFDNNIEYELLLAFTSPSLPVEVSGSNIEMKIDLLGAEKPNGGDVNIDGVNLQGGITWYTQKVVMTVEAEGEGSNPNNETLRHCADYDSQNTEKRLIDTYIGDGPAPHSLSALHVGTTATALWKPNNTGTGLPLADLLATQTLRFRKKPQGLFQVTFIEADARPINRFVDQDKGWMATRISLSAFENLWSGDFLLMDGDVDGIISSEPHVPGQGGGGGGPVISLPPSGPTEQGPAVGDGGFTVPPFDGLGGGTLPGYVGIAEQGPTRLRQSIMASTFNSTHSLPINTVGGAWVVKGDQVTLINPITGYRETFTVDATPTPTASSLSIKSSESMVKDFPYGSIVKLAPKTAAKLRGWCYLERAFTGTLLEVPTTSGLLPTVANYDDNGLRLMVQVWRAGQWLIYDTDESYQNSFHIQNTDPQGILFHFPCDGEDVMLVVR